MGSFVLEGTFREYKLQICFPAERRSDLPSGFKATASNRTSLICVNRTCL